MTPERAAPVAALRDCVRCFERRVARLVGDAVIYPIAARPEQILEFYFGDRYLVRTDDGAQKRAPSAVVVGPCTGRRDELVLQGSFDVFTIHFQASGFRRLFRVPMGELADRAYEARAVIGPGVSELEQELAAAPSFGARIEVATRFLLRQGRGADAPDPVAQIANRFLLAPGAERVDEAAARAGLGVRQFERRFVEQVGLPPKRYAGIVRFNAALQAKRQAPGRLWTDIAHAVGYYDQMHMVHDFRRLAGESPAAFERRLRAMAAPWA